MSRARWSLSVILAVVLFQAAFCAAAGGEGGAAVSGKNVQITLTIARSAGGNTLPKVVKFTGQDGTKARLLTGWRTPIPTHSTASDQAGKAPVTNYIYQNVGVSAELMVNVLGQGRIQLEGQIEMSGAREGPPVGAGAERAPLIGTFQQALNVITVEGKKLRVAEAPDPEGGTMSLDIEATVLQ